MISFWVFYCLTAIVVPVWSSAIGNCSSQCPPNEVYKKCNLPSCAEITCDRKFVCDISSCTPGCGCLDGYIRETNGGTCVLPRDCPSNSSTQCPPNEIYKKCNGAACADVTCDRPNGPVCDVISCTPGCGCLEGYIRETNGGPCVLPGNCPNKCLANEVFNPDCYNLCIQDPSCVNPNPNITRPLPIFCDVLSCGRCVCTPGYIRFGPKTSHCIKRKQCPRICRDPNAAYQECDSSCGHDCASVRNPDRVCDASCAEGCFCTPPYVLNERTQYCVLPRNCPK